MLRIDGRVLVASVVAVFVVGAAIGFVLAGSGGSPTTASNPDPTATPGPTPNPTPSVTAAVTGTGTGTASGTAVASPTATVAPTAVPTATPTVTPAPTPAPTRTPILIRRFDAEEIEAELRRMINEWRRDQELPAFTGGTGRLVGDLNAMAYNHSVDMADLGQTIHTIDNRSSAGRYHDSDLYYNCRFKRNGSEYFVTPNENSLEVLGRTYAGRTYQTPNGTDFNANETAVARDILEQWTENTVYRYRLSYHNATRIGLGVELTGNNEVYATGNLCGGPLPGGPDDD